MLPFVTLTQRSSWEVVPLVGQLGSTHGVSCKRERLRLGKQFVDNAAFHIGQCNPLAIVLELQSLVVQSEKVQYGRV